MAQSKRDRRPEPKTITSELIRMMLMTSRLGDRLNAAARQLAPDQLPDEAWVKTYKEYRDTMKVLANLQLSWHIVTTKFPAIRQPEHDVDIESIEDDDAGNVETLAPECPNDRDPKLSLVESLQPEKLSGD